MQRFPARRWWLAASIALFGLLLAGSAFAALPSWQIETVDSNSGTGSYTSLALDSQGKPHISYHDQGNAALKYASWTGSSWQTETVGSAGVGGWYTSLALDSQGNPHISYYDISNSALAYASWTGSAWQTETVDSDGDVGQYTSLVLDSQGNPHISYFDVTNGDLKYAFWSGSSWQTETVASDGIVGWYTSLALGSNDVPHISFYDDTNFDLNYASWTGSSWQIETVDDGGNVGYYTSLALDSQANPHISYLDVTNQDLNYASWTGSTWQTETVDSESAVGYYTSLALDSNDIPHISYFDNGNGDLKYTTWAGSAWQTEVVDSDGSVGQFTSLVLDRNDVPHISYYDNSSSVLTYASLPSDLDAPTTSASATTADTNSYTFGDWTNLSVSVTLSADDADGSGVADTFYTLNGGSQQTYTGAALSITAEGTTTLAYWSTDNVGNVEPQHTVTIKIDTTLPTATGTPTSSPNSAGWYNTPVIIHWICNDGAGSGVASCPEDQTINAEGTGQTVNETVTDNAGNSVIVTSNPAVNIDLTDPTITYSGNQGSYTVDQTIDITCQATDNLSGLAATDCQDVTGSAANFGPGTHTFSSSATDHAGNTGTASVTFTVGVTYDSLSRLTEQYASNARLGQQLSAPLGLAALAQRTHNSRMEVSALNSYILLVQTQRGRGLTVNEANTLIQLAQMLQ